MVNSPTFSLTPTILPVKFLYYDQLYLPYLTFTTLQGALDYVMPSGKPYLDRHPELERNGLATG